MKAEDILIKNRVVLLLDQPFFGTLACERPLVEMCDIPTIQTDGYIFGFNPDWILALPPEQVKGILAHEVLHIAFEHHRRCGERNVKLWNIACDFAINPILLDAGFSLPKGRFVSRDFQGMAAEQIYALLLSRTKEIPTLGPDQDPGNCGAVVDAPQDKQTPQEVQDEKISLARAKQLGTMAGKPISEVLDRHVESLISPPLSWRVHLAAFVDKHSRDDYTYTRPNRRFAQSEFIMPSLKSDCIDIVVAIDTSCSIDDEVLAIFSVQLNSMLTSFSQVKVTILYSDTDVRHVEEFDTYDLPIRLKPRGGGGTDFRPVFTWIERERSATPRCLVFFTDLEGVFPEVEPGYPILWVIPPNTSQKLDAPFGEVIRMEKE